MSTDRSGVAQQLDRVGTLLGAGLPAGRAWQLAFESNGSRAFLGVADAIDSGVPIGDAIGSLEGSAWLEVAVVWRIAERTGASASAVIGALAESARDMAAIVRAIDVSLAGPRASARIVLALPLLGIVLGAVTGTDALGVLVGGPLGWTLVAGGGMLVWAARRWTRALVRRATPSGASPGILLDAWAVAVSGGGSWENAGLLVEHAFAVSDDTRAALEAETGSVEEVLALARRAGVPAAALLRAAATDRRRDAAATRLEAVERLSVDLLVPLGVCILPAFVLVGVLPVIVAVFSSTAAAF